MKKIISIGLLSGIIMLGVNIIIGQAFQFVFPLLKEEYQNTNLFRPWSDPLMSLMFIHPFIVGIIMAAIWNETKAIIQGDTPINKGIRFGLIYWIVSVPGMIISYGTFPISPILTISWTVAILAQTLCSGILFSKILK